MEAAEILKQGGVAVVATDTLYGVVAVATNPKAVERVYKLKGRAPTKPCIILISAVTNLEKFRIALTDKQKEILAKYWPGPVSIALSCPHPEFEYLHRGTASLAFRLPADESLAKLIEETGPLIAPSANPEGLPPATTIQEAKNYFGTEVDCYVDSGKREGLASTLIEISEIGEVKLLRQGSIRI